jgi:hypothetical protein
MTTRRRRGGECDIVGGGKRAPPITDARQPLELLDMQQFAPGAVELRTARARRDRGRDSVRAAVVAVGLSARLRAAATSSRIGHVLEVMTP